jgi:hypothetical protein
MKCYAYVYCAFVCYSLGAFSQWCCQPALVLKDQINRGLRL